MAEHLINLYTSKPTDGCFRALTTLLAQQQPVRLCDLVQLPQPDLTRRQQKRAELVGLKAQLGAVLYSIRVGESNPKRYGYLLYDLCAQRNAYALRIDHLERQLNEQQKGGLPHA